MNKILFKKGLHPMPKVLAVDGAPTSNIDKPRVLVCLFSYAGIAGRTLEALLNELLLMGTTYGIKYTFFNVADDALISRSRSKALSAFLQGEFDVCAMVDHDMQWNPGELLALIMQAHKLKSCVSGIYSSRAIGRGLASRAKTEMSFKTTDDKMFDAEYLSGGFLAIPRVVAEEVLKAGEQAHGAMNDAHGQQPGVHDRLANLALHPCIFNSGPIIYDFFRPICVPRTLDPNRTRTGLPTDGKYEYLSEDWAFSWRCTQANPNRPLYLWTLPQLTHWGDYGYTIKTAFAGIPGAVTREGAGEGTVPKVTL